MINSIGLPNKGLEGYLAEDLPQLAGFRSDPAAGAESLPVPLITNVMGSTAEELAALVRACDARARDRRDRAERLLPERRDRASTSAPTPPSWRRVVAAVRPLHRASR